MPFSFHSGGGPAQGVGPIAEIGPGGAFQGRIVGLQPALKFAAAVAAPVTAAALAARQRTRDFNDAESFPIEGVTRGKVPVGGGPRPPRGQPTPPGGTTPSGADQDLEDAYWTAHAKRAGRENRGYYRRTMGTPRRRPYEEKPFGPEDYGEARFKAGRKPGDTTDLRRGTP